MSDKLKEVPGNFEAKLVLKQVDEKCSKNGNQDWANRQLYQVLCMYLEGNALSVINVLEERKETNGVLGWCKLVQDCSSVISQRLQGLAQKVYSPKHVKNYAEVNSAIEEWESNCRLFINAGEGNEINQTTKNMGFDRLYLKSLKRT